MGMWVVGIIVGVLTEGDCVGESVGGDTTPTVREVLIIGMIILS